MKKIKVGNGYVIAFTDDPNGCWRRAHIFWGVNNNKPNREQEPGADDRIIIESHGDWGESTFAITNPPGYIYSAEMDALGVFMLWLGELRARHAATWAKMKRQGLRSVERYPDERLQWIVDGNTLDWDDNIDRASAAGELKRRRGIIK